jgi:hypothetical protein
VLEEVVEARRVVRVRGREIGILVAGDRPPVRPVVRLGPPAVEDAELERPVERRLHPARPAGLHRPPGQVHPDVAAGDEVTTDLEVVVLDEDDSSRDVTGRPAKAEDPLEHVLALRVVRVCLSGDQELDGPGPLEDPPHTAQVVREQREPLVGREPAGEAERQHV